MSSNQLRMQKKAFLICFWDRTCQKSIFQGSLPHTKVEIQQEDSPQVTEAKAHTAGSQGTADRVAIQEMPMAMREMRMVMGLTLRVSQEVQLVLMELELEEQDFQAEPRKEASLSSI